ncbi:hypothetical protein PFICI_08600 [Pestalotiopsis fici W106-1]|uniref:Uncharacterized protein n=1 Tax=Pestalotiopsis fici (strain W106-1 / CGMCC3.15140) TaxID=1229662 RepID=W3X076_PESFW|nr:uncharacterized protein PFICI_08600 [Pestalotiopsis fici W106-1]ETS78747.1 hypothetical protein PFICI_08600 [Pestalotiopsis fici W106-1]
MISSTRLTRKDFRVPAFLSTRSDNQYMTLKVRYSRRFLLNTQGPLALICCFPTPKQFNGSKVLRGTEGSQVPKSAPMFSLGHQRKSTEQQY